MTLDQHEHDIKVVSNLVHDGILRIFALNNCRLHKVALLIVALSAGDDVQVRRRLGVIKPLLYPAKRLQEKVQKASKGRVRSLHTHRCSEM